MKSRPSEIWCRDFTIRARPLRFGAALAVRQGRLLLGAALAVRELIAHLVRGGAR